MMKVVLEGKIQGNERGYGFFIPDDSGLGDFFVSHSDMRGAMHGDFVLCECVSKRDKTYARVLKIIKRGFDTIVGTFFWTKGGGFVRPDDKRYFCDVYINRDKGVYASSGQKVVCKILSYPYKINPEGIVTEILGKQFTRQAEVKSIIRSFNLPLEFAPEVIKESNALSEPTINDLKNRTDFSNLNTFTIDGEDSRDFDDAVSIEKHADGGYTLGVHIADVTHYVKEGGKIDREAFLRGTSVYFPENVIPMLPERLSNDLCSLKEGVVRLTMSCVINLDDKGNAKSYQVLPSYIKSKARLTYNQVMDVFSGKKEVCEKINRVLSDLLIMQELARKLQQKRKEKACVDLEVNESAITVNNGKIEIFLTPKDSAHGLIEEFMILANVCVCRLFDERKVPFIYRIHDIPDENKHYELMEFLNGIGLNIGKNQEISTSNYAKILDKAKDSTVYPVVNRVMLRSMQKAKYSSVNRGHFGLGEELYCHFTSPIRRYPDLYVHRIIKDYLNNNQVFVYKKYLSSTKEVADLSSQLERNAMEAERAMDDYYKVLYISEFIGEKFTGVVSGLTSFGIFVELANGIEGLVKMETIKGKLNLDQKNYILSCANGKFRLGDEVRIVVAGVDVCSRRAEFVLFENNTCQNTKKRVV